MNKWAQVNVGRMVTYCDRQEKRWNFPTYSVMNAARNLSTRMTTFISANEKSVVMIYATSVSRKNL